MRLRSDCALEAIEQRRRDREHLRTAIAQHESVISGRQQCVDRDRHRTDLQRAPEQRDEIDSVHYAEQHSLLHLDAEADEYITRSIYSGRQIRVAVAPLIVDVRSLAVPSFKKMAIDKMARGIVITRNLDPERPRFVIIV